MTAIAERTTEFIARLPLRITRSKTSVLQAVTRNAADPRRPPDVIYLAHAGQRRGRRRVQPQLGVLTGPAPTRATRLGFPEPWSCAAAGDIRHEKDALGVIRAAVVGRGRRNHDQSVAGAHLAVREPSVRPGETRRLPKTKGAGVSRRYSSLANRMRFSRGGSMRESYDRCAPPPAPIAVRQPPSY